MDINGASDSNAPDQRRDQREISNEQIVALTIKEITAMIAAGDYNHRKKTAGADGRKVTAPCWEIAHEILDSDNKVVPNFFFV